IGSMTYDGPLAIRVSEARLRGVSVEPGAAATIDGRTLTIGSLRIPLEGVPLWRPQSPRRDPGASFDLLQRDMERIQQALCDSVEGRRCGNPGGPVEQQLRQRVELLGAALSEDRPAAVPRCLRLVGLGAGLTPAGDDVLVGLLTGLSVLGTRFDLRSSLGMLETLRDQVLPVAATRTTALSYTLLEYASGGVALQPLLDILCTLGSGEHIEGLDILPGIGHTSGCDMLAGVNLAAAAAVRWGGRE
ncbi:MAG: DUF2877 domain-containing protein, partial [Chloroflexota bacterium]